MRKIIFITLFFTMSLFAQSINVALAANVSYAINDLIKEFNKDYPDIKVNTIIGSSGKLTAQIVNGAPFDIFMSADMKYPKYLYDHLATIDKPVVYAKGSLVLLTTKKNQNLSKFFGILTSKKTKKIALANPKTAPYGKVAKTVLEMMKIYDKIKKK
ncbi:MAG: molybdate ABC transporter substrate-binding protein, partial [Arcobacter sp.]